MPRLVRLYLVNIALGFALSAVFVAALIWLNVAGLGRLVAASPAGWLAAGMLFMFNGLVFAGVQFAIRIMAMAEPEGTPPGGRKTPAPVLAEPVKVPVAARRA